MSQIIERMRAALRSAGRGWALSRSDHGTATPEEIEALVEAQFGFWDVKSFGRRAAEDYFARLNGESPSLFIYRIANGRVSALPKPESANRGLPEFVRVAQTRQFAGRAKSYLTHLRGARAA